MPPRRSIIGYSTYFTENNINVDAGQGYLKTGSWGEYLGPRGWEQGVEKAPQWGTS